MRGLLQRMREPSPAADLQTLNREYHMMIYAASNRQSLTRIIESLRDYADVFRQLLRNHPDPGFRAQYQHDHEDILDALSARDGERASAGFSPTTSGQYFVAVSLVEGEPSTVCLVYSYK